MGIKGLNLVFGISIFCSLASASEQNVSVEEINFKKFTFSICIGSAFKDVDIKKDANKSANAYRIRGNMSDEGLDASRHLTDKWLKKKYLSKSGVQIQIMKCIDLYESSDLTKIYNKFTPCNNKTNWYEQSGFERQCGY